MVLMAGFDLPLRAIREQIAGALDLIVFVARMGRGRRGITHVTELCGTEEGTIVTQDLFLRPPGSDSLAGGGRPPRFADRLSREERERFIRLLSPGEKPC
jgi:pilus assembly protein CpaF